MEYVNNFSSTTLVSTSLFASAVGPKTPLNDRYRDVRQLGPFRRLHMVVIEWDNPKKYQEVRDERNLRAYCLSTRSSKLRCRSVSLSPSDD
jgi:hypothetical protein